MGRLELPHTSHCLVCGVDNPRGLKLSLFVDEQSGAVSTTFVPGIEHTGFEGILHGGVLMTVADEAMAWAAIWASRRLCVAAEFTSRFKSPARPGQTLAIRANVANRRARLLEVNCTIAGPDGETVVQAAGKFMPLPEPDYNGLLASLLPHPRTAAAARSLTAPP